MDAELFQSVSRLLKPIRSKLLLLFQCGVVHRVEQEAHRQTLQVSFDSGDTQNAIRRLQNFGFYSNPPAESEAVIVSPGGNRSAAFAISVESQKGCPTKVEEGECALYSDDGNYLALKKGGKLVIRSQSHELIQAIHELTTAVKVLSGLSVTCTGGVSTVHIPPSFNIDKVTSEVSTFLGGVE